jgi:hypothetical protein
VRPSIFLALIAFVVLLGLVEVGHGCGGTGGLLFVEGTGGAGGSPSPSRGPRQAVNLPRPLCLNPCL